MSKGRNKKIEIDNKELGVGNTLFYKTIFLY